MPPADKGMAGFEGVLKIGGNVIGIAREVTDDGTNDMIDVTSRDSNGNREKIYGLQDKNVTLDVIQPRVVNSNWQVLRNAWLSKTFLIGVEVASANGNGLSGDFLVAEFGEDQPLEDAISNRITLERTGASAIVAGVS